MPFDIECAPAAREPRHAPVRQPLDGLILILERVAASRDADRERERETRFSNEKTHQ